MKRKDIAPEDRSSIKNIDSLAKQFTQGHTILAEGEIDPAEVALLKKASALVIKKGEELIHLLTKETRKSSDEVAIIKKLWIIHGLTNGELHETLHLMDIREKNKTIDSVLTSHDLILHGQTARAIKEELHAHSPDQTQQMIKDISEKVGDAKAFSILLKGLDVFTKKIEK
ncbi:MAG: hypothetical protein WCJ39_04560 [bacterium]